MTEHSKIKTLSDYQQAALEFRLKSYTPEAAVMGLLSEAGEVAGVFQKLIRGDFTPDIAMSKLAKELGDVLWHIAAVCDDNNWTLEDIAGDNVEKLRSRFLRQTILGSGDDR